MQKFVVTKDGPRYVDMTPEEISARLAEEAEAARIKPHHVDAERNRRLQTFRFGGVEYDFDQVSANRIDKARGSALAAMMAGAESGDLRWADPNVDFGWIAKDNSFHTMDAPTTMAFGNAAAAWEGLHIIAARTLKNMTPIPEDYASDAHWPVG